MKFIYEPESNLEKFGAKVYNLLVENFSKTYYVGGMVRDLMLQRKVTDIDLATEATPDEVCILLERNGILLNKDGKRFGVLKAVGTPGSIEIATFRKDLASKGRYPQVRFIKDLKQDSERRDFTINSLYLSTKTNRITDPNKGVRDLKTKQVSFIGPPEKRINQDPLRILRAIRFCLLLDFKLESETKKAIYENWELKNRLTNSRINSEIKKIKSPILSAKLKSIVADKKRLTML